MSEDLSKEDIDVEIDDVDKNGDNSIVVVPTVKDRIVFYLMGNGDKALEGLQFNEWIHLVILLFCFVFIGLPTSFLLVYTNDLQDSYGFPEWCSAIFSIAPLVAVEMFLGFPPSSEFLKSIITSTCVKDFITPNEWYFKWIYLFLFSLLVPITWTIGGMFFIQFNPLSFVYIFFTTFGSLEICLRNRNFGIQTLSGSDLLIFVLLFAPLDYRWVYTDYYYGAPHLGYDWWAIAVTTHGIMCYLLFIDYIGFGYRLIPTWKDILIACIFLVFLGIPIIPLGLLSGFLVWDEIIIPSFLEVFALWWENIVSIAITEELFFRVILMNGLNQYLKQEDTIRKYNKGGWIGLLFSAIVFGLMHLPRRSGDIISQILYVSFAFISGLCYGGSYILSGNNIIAPVITHSVTDTVWAFLFR